MPAESLQAGATIGELFAGFADAPPLTIDGIAADSRRVQSGFLFLACDGASSHGLDYVNQAIARGAVAVAYDSDTGVPNGDIGVPVVAVPRLAGRLGEVANRWYASPSTELDVVAVTGTNGKTTVAWLVANCLQRLGRPCGYVGTLGAGLHEIRDTGGMTTPAVLDLHAELADFVAANASHAALEVSSHALMQKRIDGVRIKAALFTNLTRDHLDYHGSMRDYFEAKARLFLDHEPECGVINVDSEYGSELAKRCRADVVSVSTQTDSGFRAAQSIVVENINPTAAGSEVSFSSSWGNGRLEIPLPGDFNVANAILVLGSLLADGIDVDDACEVLQSVDAPPGRMQRIGSGMVIVDYAHTPNALEAALRALRPHSSGQLWCVFGCGGDRDRGKRALMGQVAERGADRIVVTSDNPRGEDPQAIIDDIVSGMNAAATVIEDRAAAIAWAVREAAAGDLILIAGKGHEDYQEICGKRLPFSDVAVAAQALSAQEGKR